MEGRISLYRARNGTEEPASRDRSTSSDTETAGEKKKKVKHLAQKKRKNRAGKFDKATVKALGELASRNQALCDTISELRKDAKPPQGDVPAGSPPPPDNGGEEDGDQDANAVNAARAFRVAWWSGEEPVRRTKLTTFLHCLLWFCVFDAFSCWVSPDGFWYFISFYSAIRVYMLLSWALSFGNSRIKHEYKYVRDYAHPETDLRADSLSLGDLKHKKPFLIWVSYTKITCPWYGSCIDHRTRSIERVCELLISTELLAQCAVLANLNVSMSETVVWDRVLYALKSIHSVNVSRWAAITPQNVHNNTGLVAYGLYKQLVRKSLRVPFPLTPTC